MIRYFNFYHEGLQPALRKGENPRLMITTTPKRVRLIRDLIEESRWEFTGEDGGPGTGVHLTEAITAENIHFARKQRERLERKYAGNPVMLAQELRGEMLAEVDGALFPIDQFNETRVFPAQDTLPKWRQVVVAIDPATTSRDSSDESGIVVARRRGRRGLLRPGGLLREVLPRPADAGRGRGVPPARRGLRSR